MPEVMAAYVPSVAGLPSCVDAMLMATNALKRAFGGPAGEHSHAVLQ